MKVNVEGFRLSPQQERLWLARGGGAAGRSQCAVVIDGELDERALEVAVARVAGRHEILRTSYQRQPGLKVPFQVIGEEADPSWRRLDLSAGGGLDVDALVGQLLDEEAAREFDLAGDAPLRLCLARLAERRHALVVTLPALSADGDSLTNLVGEISDFYAGAPPAGDEPLQYADFSEWQHDLLNGGGDEEGKSFWRRHDFAALAALDLPGEARPAGAQNFRPRRLARRVALLAALEEAARLRGATTEHFLLACWQTLLWRLTGRPEIVVGVHSDGRANPEAAGAVGLFARWLPVRCRFEPDSRFGDVLRETAAAADRAREWQDYFVWGREGSAARAGDCFAAGFEYEGRAAGFESGAVRFSLHSRRVSLESFKVKLSCGVREGALALEFHFDPEVLAAETVERMAGQFETLLASAVGNPEEPAADLEVVGEAEREYLLHGLNRTRGSYEFGACLHRLFEHQAAARPTQVAAVFEGERLTYAELNERAGRLAGYLRGLGVGPDVPVAVFLERSMETVVALLGVLRAGGAYVPLEVAQPKARLGYMLEDVRAPVIVTHRHLAGLLPEHRARLVCLDAEAEEIARAGLSDAGPSAAPENLAYVIFTSGSTGRPKGVGVEHRQLVNYVRGVTERLGLEAGWSYATVSTFAADLGHTMVFPSLCAGGSLHVVAQERVGDPVALAAYFREHQIDCLKIVPSHFESLLHTSEPERLLPRRRLVLGGEPSRWDMVEWAGRAAPDCSVFNHYGPTETTVGVIAHRVEGARPSAHDTQVPLGRPLPNTRIYLLDANLRPAPFGVLGEVHVGGAGLARGYVNLPAKTAERFIPDPFGGEPGGRLYRTGDLARYRPDGTLEFAGRADNQIKFHGYRVELGELRAALNRHPQVRDSVVSVTKDEGGKAVLVAYYVARRELGSAELREFLAESILAETMPNVFVHLKRLPLTLNGKINYEALPALSEVRPSAERKFTPPTTEVEQTLARIWSQVLRVERVGVDDNFFELGGDSILSIQIIGRANEAGLRFTPSQLFQHQTIAGLAAVAGTASAVPAEQTPVAGPVPLTPIQHWFFEKELPEPHHWNQAVTLEADRRLDAGWLAEAARALVAHHDALRLRFERDGGGWRQSNEASEAADIFTGFDLSALAEPEQEAAMRERVAGLQASLNLTAGPLVSVCLFDLGADRPSRLHFIVHHLAVDGVSWRILLEDLHLAYQQLGGGRKVELPPKTTSFKRWAERLAEHAAAGAPDAEAAHWLHASEARVPAAPSDFEGGENTEAGARLVTEVLDAEETDALLREVTAAYRAQVNDLLLAALAGTLAEWTGSRRVLVELEGHGREELFDDVDLSRTVGWFTTRFPVFFDLGAARDPGDILKAVKEQLRAVPGGGVGYGLLRYLGADEALRRRLRDAPRPEVSFNYLGQFDQALPESPLFRVREEFGESLRSPRGRRGHLLEVNAIVIGGRLQTVWRYGEGFHRRATVGRLAARFTGRLRSLIEQSREPEACGFTPSDFPLADIDQQGLERLSRLMGEIDNIEEVAS